MGPRSSEGLDHGHRLLKTRHRRRPVPVEGKAELIGGRIVQSCPADSALVRSREIAVSVTQRTGRGIAIADGTGFTVPDFPRGASRSAPTPPIVPALRPDDMRFVEGPPTFAVEVRSENDYGPKAERDIAAKRADYFAAGTLVVWDVDPIDETIAPYSADRPDQPTLFTRGQTADAEPAVPGWRVQVRHPLRS